MPNFVNPVWVVGGDTLSKQLQGFHHINYLHFSFDWIGGTFADTIYVYLYDERGNETDHAPDVAVIEMTPEKLRDPKFIEDVQSTARYFRNNRRSDENPTQLLFLTKEGVELSQQDADSMANGLEYKILRNSPDLDLKHEILASLSDPVRKQMQNLAMRDIRQAMVDHLPHQDVPTILLVHEDLQFLESRKKALEAAGYNVLHARSNTDAMNILDVRGPANINMVITCQKEGESQDQCFSLMDSIDGLGLLVPMPIYLLGSAGEEGRNALEKKVRDHYGMGTILTREGPQAVVNTVGQFFDPSPNRLQIFK